MNLKLNEQWAENFFLLFIVLGFILAVCLNSSFLSYFSIFLAGFIAGRVYYFKISQEPIFAFVLIIIGFLFGYLAGSIWVSRIIVLILFALGFGISYYLHAKEILVKFKSEDFVK